MSVAQTDSPFISVDEIAQRLEINRKTAYGLLRAGILPGVRKGKNWLIRRADINAYIRGEDHAASAPALTADAGLGDLLGLLLSGNVEVVITLRRAKENGQERAKSSLTVVPK